MKYIKTNGKHTCSKVNIEKVIIIYSLKYFQIICEFYKVGVNYFWTLDIRQC